MVASRFWLKSCAKGIIVRAKKGDGLLDNDATFEVWKVTIEVQKHFNDLGMRVRSIAITVLGAFLAAAGYALKERQAVYFGETSVSLSGLILISALICWAAFYVMDRLWYHRLLKAAVKHGEKVEEALLSTVPLIGLTRTIHTESPLFGFRAGHRLSVFYISIAVLLMIAAGVAFRHALPAVIAALVLVLLVFLAEFLRQRSKLAGDDKAPEK